MAAGEFTLGTGGRCQGDRMHAGDFLEDLLQLVQTSHDALTMTGGGQRVAPQKTRQRGQAVAGPGVVLHGTGTQGIEMGIDGEVPLRQPGVVTYDLEFGDLRQIGPPLAAQMLRQVVRRYDRHDRHDRCLGAGTASGT